MANISYSALPAIVTIYTAWGDVDVPGLHGGRVN